MRESTAAATIALACFVAAILLVPAWLAGAASMRSRICTDTCGEYWTWADRCVCLEVRGE